MTTRADRVAVWIRIVALPVTIVAAVLRALARVWSCRYAWSNQMRCRYCHAVITLVRAWRCGCGFTYVGSVLRVCPICGMRPRVVRCEGCGLTWKVR